jgi:hypothetical protein
VAPYFATVSTPQLEHASAFMCGLLGMSISQGLYNIGRYFRRRPLDVIGRAKPQA